MPPSKNPSASCTKSSPSKWIAIIIILEDWKLTMTTDQRQLEQDSNKVLQRLDTPKYYIDVMQTQAPQGDHNQCWSRVNLSIWECTSLRWVMAACHYNAWWWWQWNTFRATITPFLIGWMTSLVSWGMWMNVQMGMLRFLVNSSIASLSMIKTCATSS